MVRIPSATSQRFEPSAPARSSLAAPSLGSIIRLADPATRWWVRSSLPRPSTGPSPTCSEQHRIFEIPCWNGEVVRGAFAIDTHDREVMAWVATAGAGIGGEMVRDMMLERVERRFDALRAPQPVQWLADNWGDGGLRHRAEPRPLLHAGPQPESNGVCEAFVKTMKRDYFRVNPRPDAISVPQRLPAWFEDYNTVHRHSGLQMRSPREFIARQSATPAECPVRRVHSTKHQRGKRLLESLH